MKSKKKKVSVSLDLVMVRTIRRVSILMAIAALLVGGGAYSRMAVSNSNKTIGDVNRLFDLAIDIEQLKKVDDAVMGIYDSLEISEIRDPGGEEYAASMHAYEKAFERVADMPEYAYLRQLAYRLNQSIANAESVYLMDIDPENSRIVYLADGYDEKKDDKFFLPGTVDFISAKSMKLFKEDHPYRAVINRDSYRGFFYYDYQPVRDENGDIICYLGVDLDLDEVVAGHRRFIFMTLLATAFVSILVTWLAILASRKSIAPIKELTQAARDYNYTYSKRDRVSTRFFKGIDAGNIREIQELINSMRTMEIGMNVYMEKIAVVTAERERINTELGIANRIQSAMLPCMFPAFPDREDFDIYAIMDPAKEVGGDFYDFFLIDENHLAIVMADVSGKGVPAALFMMASKILLYDRANVGGEPGEILEKVNEALCSNNQEDMFVTVWLGILELSTGRLLYANAGHEHPALRHNGIFGLIIERHNFVLGGLNGMKFKTFEMYLKPNDMLFLYTDGVAEAMNSNYELFGTDRMVKALNKHSGGTPIDVVKGVSAEVNAFVKRAPQFDDITMLCLQYFGDVKKEES